MGCSFYEESMQLVMETCKTKGHSIAESWIRKLDTEARSCCDKHQAWTENVMISVMVDGKPEVKSQKLFNYYIDLLETTQMIVTGEVVVA